MVAVEAVPLTPEEHAIITRLRHLRQHYPNFKLSIYGQGSASRSILDMEWSPRIRLSQQSLPLSIED